MPDEHTHIDLVERGLAIHEQRRYDEALPYFDEAGKRCPGCPIALYNRANTLHMLDRHEDARVIFEHLVAEPPAELEAGCDEVGSVRSLQLDAYHMLFITTLYSTGSWRTAVPHLREHLRRRRRGLASLWSKAQVLRDAEDLRRRHAPRARPVRG